MNSNPEPVATPWSAGARFVRKYMIGIFLVIGLIILSVFLGFSYKSTALIESQLLQEGRAFFRQIELTREWIDHHDGVYVKLAPGVEINAWLLQVPGRKVVIRDKDGERYTLKHSPIVIGEISRMAAAKGVVKFKITSLDPINPDNAPDPFERASLEKFVGGTMEQYSLLESGQEVLFRYMAPFVVEDSCLECHSPDKGGKTLGGISVSIPATSVVHEIRRNRVYLAVTAIGILLLFLLIISFISKSFVKDLKEAERKLVELATLDSLTGLFNRREALRRIGEELSRADRLSKPTSVVMIDIDYFKKINDTYGHAAGDGVLKELSRRMREVVREYDIVCRFGGEEFLVMTPEAGVEAARSVAERLRFAAEGISVASADGSAIRFTISAGVAQRKADEDIDRLIGRADAALYDAKAAGRNRVIVAG
jgi:diguanylate cyclase (GGDEF)-like protein